MNNLKSRFAVLVLVAAACFAFSARSSATLINITTNLTSTALVNDLSKIDVGGNNSPAANFSALVSDVGRYETFTSTSLPNAVYAGYGDFAPGTVSLTGFDYAVLHYGAGNDGNHHNGTPGGGFVFYYLNGMTGNYDVPCQRLWTKRFWWSFVHPSLCRFQHFRSRWRHVCDADGGCADRRRFAPALRFRLTIVSKV